MNKIEYHAFIKFFVKEGLTRKEIHLKFIKVYGNSPPSFSTIKKWAAKFKRGRTSLEVDPHEGRPKSATTPEITEQVHNMILDDRWIKVHEIAETIGISRERVGCILHEKLDMKKLCARWVPRLFTADQKRTRMKISEQCLEHFNRNKTDFVRQFITMDETWIHHYTPESKQQSKQWTEAGCSAPKKTRSVPSAGKVMALVFWDAEGILFINYLEKGKTITGEYYSSILTRLDEKICEKRSGLQKKKIIFHQDNEPAHKSVLAMRKLRDLHYETLKHPTYSPDLAPSDFYLYPNLKLFFVGQCFSSNQEANAAVEGYFADLTKNHYRDGIMMLEHHWNKCISLKGDYIEK
jgi:histone-lysine N-methyltransferase SETMAR